jgi:hypothetical protein
MHYWAGLAHLLVAGAEAVELAHELTIHGIGGLR